MSTLVKKMIKDLKANGEIMKSSEVEVCGYKSKMVKTLIKMDDMYYVTVEHSTRNEIKEYSLNKLTLANYEVK